MNEQDYIQLNTLLAKLRVECLRNLSETGKISDIEKVNGIETRRIVRNNRDINSKLVRSIDNIRKYTPVIINDEIKEEEAGNAKVK